MTAAVDTTQQLATVPAPTAGPAPAAGYVGRHRADQHERRHTPHQVADPVSPTYTPLSAGTRQHLGQHYYAETALPAPITERTAHIDPAAVLALTAPSEPATTGEVLAELRADLTPPPRWFGPTPTKRA